MSNVRADGASAGRGIVLLPFSSRLHAPVEGRPGMEPRLNQHLKLFDHWNEKRRGRLMPARSDIDIPAIGRLLPYLTLLDVVGTQFRYRVVGSRLVEDLGVDYTGMIVGENSNAEYAAALLRLLSQVRDQRIPIYSVGIYRSSAVFHRRVSRLLLPLGGDDRHANMILISRVAQTLGFDRDVRWDMMKTATIVRSVPAPDRDILRELCLEWEQSLHRRSDLEPLPTLP